MQTTLNGYGSVILKVDKNFFSQSLDEINKQIKNTRKNLPNDLREAVIHECGHAKVYYRKNAKEISTMNKELEKIHTKK